MVLNSDITLNYKLMNCTPISQPRIFWWPSLRISIRSANFSVLTGFQCRHSHLRNLLTGPTQFLTTNVHSSRICYNTHTRACEVYLSTYCRLAPRVLLRTTCLYIAHRVNVTDTTRLLLHERTQSGARSKASAVALRAISVLLDI